MMRRVALAALLLMTAPAMSRAEIPKDMIKIGVLQDLPQPYAGFSGNGGIVAAQMAASDFETEHVHGDAEILPSVSRGGLKDDIDQVREWLNVEHVAAIVSSAPAITNRIIAQMAAKVHATLLVATTDANMSDQPCLPNVVVWGAGPAARARALTQVLLPRGGKEWFVMADQSMPGLSEMAALQQAVKEGGGQVVGTNQHPVGEADLRKASDQITKAGTQVLALAENDGDLISALRSASLSGLDHRTIVAAPFAQITDIDNAPPSAAEGVVVAAPFYWDTDQQTRHFALRWSHYMQAQHVTENAAMVYAATLSFLHAAKAADDVASDKVLAQLRHAPIKHTLFGTVHVRKDGRVMYDIPVYLVKQPNQIQARWAYYTKLADVPATKVFPDSCSAETAKPNG